MKPLELAKRYMDILFTEQSPDLLRELLTGDCVFEGPFYTFNTAAEYIASLKEDPPTGFDYELIKAFDNDHSACLVYQFKKPGISIPMVQTFEVTNEGISRILLVFDTAAFSR